MTIKQNVIQKTTAESENQESRVAKKRGAQTGQQQTKQASGAKPPSAFGT
jgi:hypothetical protein